MVPNATRVTVRLVVVCLSGTLVTIISKRRAEKGGLVMLFDILATHAGLVCDVSDTDHWAWVQNGSIQMLLRTILCSQADSLPSCRM